MSAPSSSGCWASGEANVLSTTTMGDSPRAPVLAWVNAATWAMSTSFNNGLLGDSSQTMRVSGVSSAASVVAGSSLRSTQRASTPRSRSTRSNSRYVPPYTSSLMSTRSPGRTRPAMADAAAEPLANARPCAPPSRIAIASSNRFRVGLPVRAYSHPPIGRPTPSCANVLV